MSIWKRAYLHTVRKKGKTALIFCILLIVSTLILTCLAIRSATDTAALNIRRSLMGYFTLNAKHLDNMLEGDAAAAILDLPGIAPRYNLRSYFHAEYRDRDGGKLKTKTEGAAPATKGYEHAGKMIGSSHSESDVYFQEGGFELIDGRHITAEDTNAILVSDDFAQRNGLKVGGRLVLGDIGSGREIEMEIVGIFTPAKRQESVEMAPPEEQYENVAFTDDKSYSRLCFENGDHYQYADFYADDPSALEGLMEEVKGIPGVNWEACTFTKNDADYQRSRTELEALQSLVTAIVYLLIAVSVVMLALILLLWVRNRMQEIGMLLAMGVGKGSIYLQHVAEILIIAVFAFTLSFATSSLIAQGVGDALFERATIGDRVTANDLTGGTTEDVTADDTPSLVTIDVRVSAENLLLVYGMGTGILFLSIALASIPILRLKPKEILTKMS